MGKGSGKGSVGNSRIRFIMLDADLNDGDLNQITQAITNALRPASGQRALPALPRQTNGNGIGAATEEPDERTDDAEDLISDVNEVAAPRASAASPRTRTYRTPQVLDVDFKTADVPFAEFAAAKNPPDEATKRYLVVAAWFKEYGKLDAITTDHVYTAFRLVKWPTNIADFDLPFRKLKSAGWVKRVDKGKYEINHLGLDEVERMGPVTNPNAAS